MLFALNGHGTPSIARWIKLLATNGATGHPTSVQDLALSTTYGLSDAGVTLHWTAPHADSGTVGCRGPASQYQIRYRYGSLATWGDFLNYGSIPPPPPPPGPPALRPPRPPRRA